MKSFSSSRYPVLPVVRQLGVAIGLSLTILASTVNGAKANTGVGAIGNPSGSGVAPTHQPQKRFITPTWVKKFVNRALQLYLETFKQLADEQSLAVATGAKTNPDGVNYVIKTSQGPVLKLKLVFARNQPTNQVKIETTLERFSPQRTLSFQNSQMAMTAAALINGVLTSLAEAGASNESLSKALSLIAALQPVKEITPDTAKILAKRFTALLMAYERLLPPRTTSSLPTELLLATRPGATTDVSPSRLAEAEPTALPPKDPGVDVEALAVAIAAYNNLVQTLPLEVLTVLSKDPEFQVIGEKLRRLNLAARPQTRQTAR